MKNYLFFDHASTTQCCRSAAELVLRFACEEYGNPSSSHVFGQTAAKAIKEARQFFATHFKVDPRQVIFTGGGTEADNLAVYGVALQALAQNNRQIKKPRVLASSMEHAAVKKTVQSLEGLGVDAQLIPVDHQGQIDRARFEELLTPDTILVSIHQVNNIVGSVFPVEELARIVKAKVPGAVFHTDAVQAFGKVPSPVMGSAVDLVSVSAHKVHGPKGVGALIVLNGDLLKDGLRPLIWGGEQEGGFRSGTQNAGLIAGFHAAAKETLEKMLENNAQVAKLRARLRVGLEKNDLLGSDSSPLCWNSPETSVPHIVSMSLRGYPSGLLAQMLQERGCLISTGSACSSAKAEPDAALIAMGIERELCGSALRISFSPDQTEDQVDTLVQAMRDSIQTITQFLGGGSGGNTGSTPKVAVK